jgi:hypothetical protein
MLKCLGHPGAFKLKWGYMDTTNTERKGKRKKKKTVADKRYNSYTCHHIDYVLYCTVI